MGRTKPSSVYYAPCFLFEKARCFGRLILQKQSTGLFPPKTLDLQGFAPPYATFPERALGAGGRILAHTVTSASS